MYQLPNRKIFSALIALVCLTGCISEPPQQSVFKKQYSDGRLKTASISQNGLYALTSDQKEVCIWNNKEKTKLYPCIKHIDASTIELSGISGNNKYFYLSNRLNVSLYQLSNGQLIDQWSSGINVINDIDISVNGAFMLLGYRSGEASIIGVKNGSFTTFKIHELDINSVSISNDGSKAFTGSSDKYSSLWDTTNGEVIFKYKHRTRVNHVNISKSSNVAVSLDAINDRFIWNLNSKTKQAELNTSLKFLEFNSTAFVSNPNRMVSGSPNRKLILWNTDDGELLQQWASQKHQGRDRASILAVSINLNKVSSINNDGLYEEFDIN